MLFWWIAEWVWSLKYVVVLSEEAEQFTVDAINVNVEQMTYDNFQAQSAASDKVQ